MPVPSVLHPALLARRACSACCEVRQPGDPSMKGLNASVTVQSERATGGHPEQEEVLRLLRDTALSRGVADVFFLADYRPPERLPLSKLSLTSDEPAREPTFFHGCQGAPQWVRLLSEDRFAWVEHLPALLRALDGRPLSVSLSSSWRWDRTRTEFGRCPVNVPIYQVLICLSASGAAFDAEKELPVLLSGVCLARHPLAAASLFDWQRQVCGEPLFFSYRWMSDGFEASFSQKRLLERAQAELFTGMPVHVSKRGSGELLEWVAQVRLPDVPPVDAPPAAAALNAS